MDKSSVAGLTLGLAGIVCGMLLEGGRVAQILQPTAALIVLGGTLGAVMLSFPARTVLTAFEQIATIFNDGSADIRATAEMLTAFCIRARRDGVLSLDREIPALEDNFLRRALTLAV